MQNLVGVKYDGLTMQGFRLQSSHEHWPQLFQGNENTAALSSERPIAQNSMARHTFLGLLSLLFILSFSPHNFFPSI